MTRTWLHILGKKIEVRWVSRMPRDAKGHCAVWIPGKHRVYVDTTFPLDEQRESLLHEILHIVDYFTAPPDSKDCRQELTEVDIDRLTVALFAALRENKGTVEWLMEE